MSGRRAIALSLERPFSFVRNGVERKKERKHRSAPASSLAASDPDRTVVFFDDVLGDPKTQARSTHILCREEGFKDSIPDITRNTGAGIGKSKSQSSLASSPVHRSATANQQAPPVGHGIKCVADKIVEHLSNLAFEADERFLDSLSSFHLDSGIQDTTLIESQDAVYKRIALNGLGPS